MANGQGRDIFRLIRTIACLAVAIGVGHICAPRAEAFCFDEAGTVYRISPQLLESIARTESNLNTNAINRNANGSFDYGLMQINSYWVRTYGLSSNDLMNDACYNVKVGAWILRQCMDHYGYNWNAVGCYNAASKAKRARYAWKVFTNLRNNKGSRTDAR